MLQVAFIAVDMPRRNRINCMTLTPESPVSGPIALPRRTKLLWSFGGAADMMMHNGTSALLQQVYVSALGVAPLLFSAAIAVPRFLDIALDPLIGHWSDNTRSRWGRRKPWMFLGAILSGLVVSALWYPPLAWGATAVFLFLAVAASLLYSLGYGAYVIAHNAMGYEMTGDYDERTHLFKWRMCAAAAAGIFTPWLPRLCLVFEGDRAEVLKGAEGVKWVGALLGVAIMLSGLVPVLFCSEGKAAARRQAKVPLRDAVRMTLSNRPFWLLVVSNVITKTGMMVTGVFCFYLITCHVGGGSLKAGTVWWGLYVNSINISMLLAMGPIALLTERSGKKAVLIFGLAMSALIYGSIWWTMTPVAPWLCIVTGVFTGAFTNTMPMIKNSMLADVCDYDELNTGCRREAFYSAVFVTSDKLAMAVSLACQGWVLGWSSYNAHLSVQTPETIRYWLLAIVLTQPLGFLLGIFSIVIYPLNRQRCGEIRQQLDRREAALARPDPGDMLLS